MTTHVMLDLETLGTRPGCKILSIGAVVFGKTGISSEFYAEVKIDYQGTLFEELRTRNWWDSQSHETRHRLFSDQDTKPTLSITLDQFNKWLNHQAVNDDSGNLDLCVWGNGADFDNAVLQVAYSDVSVSSPAWPYFNNRCYRTLKALAPGVRLIRQGTHHNALDDAKSQAEHATRIMNHLKIW